MKKKLVIAGAGHAHMLTMEKLSSFVDAGYDVHVVGPSAYHYYSGMGPGMLGLTYSPEEIRFSVKTVAEKQGATFTLAKVQRIDPIRQRVCLDSGGELPYDVLSCNLGSQVSADLLSEPQDDVFAVKPIEKLFQARQRILKLGRTKKVSVGVVGGGVSALEIAGNVWRLGQEAQMHPLDVVLFTGHQLLSHYPERVRQMAYSSLRKRAIRIEENRPVQAVATGQVIFAAGQSCDLDVIFIATGVKPSVVFRESGLPTGTDGGLLVNRYLQCPAYPTIFAGGDCIHFTAAPLDKVGVYAVRQNPVIYHNLHAALGGGKFEPFKPKGKYLQIFNLGDDTGIFYRRPFVFGGPGTFRLKNYIDRKFMKRYQASE
ncbi:pyridine nucleotide-disulfide oxidoreductase family protein [Desulfuromusa kysingii]|uniref:Pyridine nucleotide-disulfide oxidoreductase family protein n=1 Tax=Desulfuromusa kysingii TaxID=37625 RepID=A0A1H4E4D4_9BACT|nr:FAD-dependent oxidoreductase [Desulfuromusa kysingii]SEA79420.1 pyridine nucleotide-disulfide oxidoreductase family protein [Desulfuromusa kysingii]